MKYRILEPKETSRLIPIFGALTPDPWMSKIAVAENSDRIVSVLCLGPQVHLEHFWICPGEYVNWRRLYFLLEPLLPAGTRLYAAPTFGNGKEMCRIVGFSKPDVPVMIKEL